MSSNQQLNIEYVTYRAEKSPEAFRRLYDLSSAMFESLHREMLRNNGCTDSQYAQETFDDAVMQIAARDDIKNFANTLSNALKRKRLMVFRTRQRRRNRIDGSLDDVRMNEAGEYTPKYELPSVPSAEDNAIAKKEADQRQLISFLLNDPSQVDHDTKKIVSQFSQHDSITALAKALGMHHEYVKRKLRRLSRRYDANRFGDYSDYLAV